MATWISVGGELHPAKEHAVLPHLAGTSKEIYDGPDRAALYMLWEESGKPSNAENAMTHFGSNFKTDPDFLARIRQMGFSSPEDYFKAVGYDDKKEIEKQKLKATTVKSHEVVKRGKELDIQGGGVEQGSGKVIISGAIGDVPMPV